MYEELIGELYLVASKTQSSCRRKLLVKAADAIEELSKELMDLKMRTCCCCEPPKEETE